MSRRKHGKIDGLSADLRETAEQMLLSNCTYADVVEYLKNKGVAISHSAVWRHAKNLHANVEMLNIAQTNFKHMMAEMDKYPNLDTTEAIVRLMSQNVFNALATQPEKAWQEMDIAKLLKESNALVKAAAYKKRIEMQNATDTEAGLNAVQQLVFEAMARERPDLYAQVTSYLESKKQGGLTDPESAEV